MTEEQEAIRFLHERGLSQRMIAKVCGVSRKHINEIKRGKTGNSLQVRNKIVHLANVVDEKDFRHTRKPYTRHYRKHTTTSKIVSHDQTPQIMTTPQNTEYTSFNALSRENKIELLFSEKLSENEDYLYRIYKFCRGCFLEDNTFSYRTGIPNAEKIYINLCAQCAKTLGFL